MRAHTPRRTTTRGPTARSTITHRIAGSACRGEQAPAHRRGILGDEDLGDHARRDGRRSALDDAESRLRGELNHPAVRIRGEPRAPARLEALRPRALLDGHPHD